MVKENMVDCIFLIEFNSQPKHNSIDYDIYLQLRRAKEKQGHKMIYVRLSYHSYQF